MLTRTNNRTPLNFNVPSKSYDKHTYMTQFNGIKDSKNVVAVDQSSFADAKNMYVSDNNVLTSRPTIKITDKTNINKIWTFNDYILILDNSLLLSVYDKSMTVKATQQYSLASGATTFKINCIQVEDKIFIYTDLLVGGNPAFYCYIVGSTNIVDAIDYIYIPITKTIVNDISSDYETVNYLTSAEKTRFIYSAISFVDFEKLLNKKVTVGVDNKYYEIDSWIKGNEDVLVSSYSNTDNNIYIDTNEANGAIVTLKFNKTTKSISVSFDGIVYYSLPYLDDLVYNSVPYISKDNLCIFAFTKTSLMCCKIAAVTEDLVFNNNTVFQWKAINYLERDENNNVYYSNNNYNNAFGYFLSEDTYTYLICPDTLYNNSFGDTDLMLYAQWNDSINEKFFSTTLQSNASLRYNQQLKMYRYIEDISTGISPIVITMLLNDGWTESGFYVNGYSFNGCGIGVIFLKEKESVSNTIYNGDIININASEFNKGVGDIGNDGYFENINTVSGNLTELKIQRWTINGDNAVLDTSTTAIQNNDYIQLVPVGYNNELDTTIDYNLLNGLVYRAFYYNYSMLGYLNRIGNLVVPYMVNGTNIMYQQYFENIPNSSINQTAKTITMNNNRTYTFDTTTLEIKLNNVVVGKILTLFNNQVTEFYIVYDYDLVNNTIKTGSTTIGSISRTINNDGYCNLTLDTISCEFYPNMVSKYIAYGISADNPSSPFRILTEKLKQDTYKITFSSTNLTNNTDIVLTDQHNGRENITGKVFKNLSSAEIHYKKAIQFNYNNGTSQASYDNLMYNCHYYKFSDGYSPDYYFTRLSKTEDNDDTIIKYRIMIAGALEYGSSSSGYVANVINDFNIEWHSIVGNISIPDFPAKTRQEGTIESPVIIQQVIKIPCLTNYNANEIIKNQIASYNSGYFGKIFKINEYNAETILTDQYLYDVNRAKLIPLIIKGINASGYISSNTFKQIPIENKDNVFYTYNNILYSTYLGVNKQITLDIVSAGDYNQVVFDSKAILDEYFLSFGNLVEITDTRRTEDDNREFLWYLPKLNEFKYVSNISDLHAISSEQVGVFLTDEIWVISLLKTDDNGIDYWKNTKTKLAMGVRAGGNTITSLSGSSTLLATPRGITEMGLQDFVQSTDQEVTYLSDTIQYLYSYFKDKPIKFALYKYWIFAYTVESKQFLVLDSRYGTWWLWEFKTNIDTILTFNDMMYILSNNKLYKLNYNDDDDYYDDTDIIEWSFTSQKLHFGDINYYKHVKTINVIATGDGRPTCKITTKAFRNHGNPEGEKVVEIKIDDITTYVKVINAMKVNEFQFKFETDIYNVTQIPVKVDNISINYKIKGMVR